MELTEEINDMNADKIEALAHKFMREQAGVPHDNLRYFVRDFFTRELGDPPDGVRIQFSVKYKKDGNVVSVVPTEVGRVNQVYRPTHECIATVCVPRTTVAEVEAD